MLVVDPIPFLSMHFVLLRRASFIFQVVKALHYLHKERHLVHRDIKLSNLLINSRGEVKVTDFGVSAELAGTMADVDTFTGTIIYMSVSRCNSRSKCLALLCMCGFVSSSSRTMSCAHHHLSSPIPRACAARTHHVHQERRK